VDFEFETLKLATLMAEYDITQKLIPFIDRHLAFPILSHLSEISLFPEEDVRFAQYELARGTNMVDFTLDLFQQLYPDQDPPPGKYRCPFL
jgi:translation initiation factor 3 subunit E